MGARLRVAAEADDPPSGPQRPSDGSESAASEACARRGYGGRNAGSSNTPEITRNAAVPFPICAATSRIARSDGLEDKKGGAPLECPLPMHEPIPRPQASPAATCWPAASRPAGATKPCTATSRPWPPSPTTPMPIPTWASNSRTARISRPPSNAIARPCSLAGPRRRGSARMIAAQDPTQSEVFLYAYGPRVDDAPRGALQQRPTTSSTSAAWTTSMLRGASATTASTSWST